MTRRLETSAFHDTPGRLVRLDRVTLARERIQSRYYERADVRRALVEALLVELAL